MLLLPSRLARLRPRKQSSRPLPVAALPGLRAAQLGAAVADCESVPSFGRNQWDELEAFQPRVLIGSAGDLHCLANLAQRNVLTLTSVDHAIFAVTRWGTQPVSDVS